MSRVLMGFYSERVLVCCEPLNFPVRSFSLPPAFCFVAKGFSLRRAVLSSSETVLVCHEPFCFAAKEFNLRRAVLSCSETVLVCHEPFCFAAKEFNLRRAVLSCSETVLIGAIRFVLQ